MTDKENKRKPKIAKPFIKWAGGKGSLVKVLAEHLPAGFCDIKNVTYIEPFVGGGAMLFYMLTHFPNISRVVINDVNADLILCYQLIKNNPELLIEHLLRIRNEYYQLQTMGEKSIYYYQMRDKYIIRKTKRFAIPERAVYILKTKRTAGGTPPPQNIFDRLTPVFT